MSLTKNGAVRCDWCGKLTRAQDVAYLRPDGRTYGRIVQPEWERFPGGRTDVGNVMSENDICEECAADRCPACGSAAVVKQSPAAPGPFGWGGRCKDCGHDWSMQHT